MLLEGKNKSWNKKIISEVMSVKSPITNEFMKSWGIEQYCGFWKE
jgi:hypothetical protein